MGKNDGKKIKLIINMLILLFILPISLQVFIFHETIILHQTDIAINLPIDNLRMIYGPSFSQRVPILNDLETKNQHIEQKF